MSHDDPHGLTLVYGAPGTGKTTLIASALREYGAHGPTLTLDLTGDIATELERRLPHDHRLVRVGSPAAYGRATRTGWFDSRPAWGPGRHCVVVLGDGGFERAVSLWTLLATEPRYRRLWVATAVDESEQLFGTHSTISPELRESVLVARNERRGMLFATKRPTAVSPYLRSAARRACVFKVLSDADARACDELGPSKLFRADGRGVQHLPRGKYLYFSGADHTPDSTLPVLDSRAFPPWLENARAHYRKS